LRKRSSLNSHYITKQNLSTSDNKFNQTLNEALNSNPDSSSSPSSDPTLRDANLKALAEEIVLKLDERNQSATLELQHLDDEIDRVDSELLPLEEKYQHIIEAAKEKADRQMLGFLSGSTVIFMTIARLTWWEYSWDIMEPIAWASQAGAVLFWSYYFFVTKNGNDLEDLADRIHEKGFRKKIEREGFSIERYNELVEERRRLEIEYMRVRKYQ